MGGCCVFRKMWVGNGWWALSCAERSILRRRRFSRFYAWMAERLFHAEMGATCGWLMVRSMVGRDWQRPGAAAGWLGRFEGNVSRVRSLPAAATACAAVWDQPRGFPGKEELWHIYGLFASGIWGSGSEAAREAMNLPPADGRLPHRLEICATPPFWRGRSGAPRCGGGGPKGTTSNPVDESSAEIFLVSQFSVCIFPAPNRERIASSMVEQMTLNH
jgi:hypothetical protein